MLFLGCSNVRHHTRSTDVSVRQYTHKTFSDNTRGTYRYTPAMCVETINSFTDNILLIVIFLPIEHEEV